MKGYTVFLVLITLIRIYLGIKVISWMLINLIAEVPHPISDIEVPLILILLDTWISNQAVQIVVNENKED